MFPEKTSSVVFKRPETRSRVSLYRAKCRCGKEDTATNNDKRLILFERTERERERKGDMRNDNAPFFAFAQLWKRPSDILKGSRALPWIKDISLQGLGPRTSILRTFTRVHHSRQMENFERMFLLKRFTQVTRYLKICMHFNELFKKRCFFKILEDFLRRKIKNVRWHK